ncbi:SDR family oxidoreductase [Streptomyces sp. NPDC050264]|uniref:SDR family NAD(P)-dependent oxidoreductase n=1 Tax=Streptomyces sp. NPDC050264 TaxID=3155038 RepID=UPI003447F7AD
MSSWHDTTPDYRGLIDLTDRHVLVLGGGQGIGRQTCLAAAALGARVSVVDTLPERAEAVAQEVKGLALVADATARADIERAVSEAVDRFGPLHGLADIIGISEQGPLTKVSDDAWQRGLDLNLRHVLLALQAGSRAMPAGGSMVFVGSISGQRSAPNHAVYGAAKAALVNLVSTAALELAPTVRVNAVAPGQTYTPRVAERHPEPDYYEKVGARVPLGRVGEPRDIASAILFFLSDLSQWITGQTLVVDGGTGRRFAYDTP